jgi:hypothetical protein
MPKRKPPARRRYDTDLTDRQWEVIAPLIPDARVGGRPRKATSRELIDAILYFCGRERHGGSCRMISRRGRRSTITSAAGRTKACGSTSVMRSFSPTANVVAVSPRRRRRSSTAGLSAPLIKRGRQGL